MSLREHEICVDFLVVSNARTCKFEVVRIYANSSIVFAHACFDCAQVALLFPGNDAEWPVFCQNVDSFLFGQISGSRFVHFLAMVMPKFSVNFGMTCATN